MALSIIRTANYRGKRGYSICGHDNVGRKIRIFVQWKPTAEAVKKAIQAGKNPDRIILSEVRTPVRRKG